MGNKSSAASSPKYSSNGRNIPSTEPPHVVSNRRNFSSRPKGFPTDQHHGKKPLRDDEAFSSYIKESKFKMKSKSNIGGHEDHSNIPVDVSNESNDSNNKENEKDHFSEFIVNARKKLRTITRRNSSIRRG